MAKGVLWTRPAGETGAQLKVLANDLANPCHIEVVDLDGDGLRDLLVADLGVVLPSDQRQGRVLWLRAKSTGEFETFVLANELGRVCDVQAADFDGDGDLDLVVAVFGWHKEGEVLLLENQGRTEEGPKFERKTIDPRHGTIHVPVGYITGGPDDISRPNVAQDYSLVPPGVAAYVAHRSIGDHVTVSTHKDVLIEDAEVSIKWIDFSLYGDATTRERLVTTPCGSCAPGTWSVESKDLDTVPAS